MLLQRLQQVRNYPPEILLKKAVRKPFSYFKDRQKRKRALTQDLRSSAPRESGFSSLVELERIVGSLPEEKEGEYDRLLAHYCEHRFDVLGSGWLNWVHSSKERGFEGWHYQYRTPSPKAPLRTLRSEHIPVSKDILDLIGDEGYCLIDWQRDMRSGFRWDATRWGKDQGKLHSCAYGADPKVPMELGRLQHLPRMAVLAEKNGKKKEAIVREFRSQVLDFIAMNPVGMGIQWFCPMDVGIRVANLLVAKDLFAQMDESGILDEKFNAVLIDSVEQHARFILENLEFQDGLTGNHYLFNVAGLLFCSAYLPQGVFGDQLLSFGLRELVRELFKQFFPSGGNFEGSTAYHILSTEMFLFSTALVLGSKDRLARMEWNEQIPLSKWSHGIEGGLRSTAEIPFSEEFVDRLGKAFSICEGLEKPNGEFPQIGDNDSGAFFRITPFGTFRNGEALKELYQDRPASDFEEKEGGFDENLLALHGKLDVGRVLFGERREASYAEGALVRSLMGKEGTLARGAIGNKEELSDHAPLGALSMDRGKYVKNSTIPFGKELDLSTGRWIVDQDAGFMIFRTPELFFIMNAPGGKGLRHTWGHVHNDRTGFELNVGGKDLVLDPGSYVYEALPEMRNRFRSVKAHSVPLHGNGFEQNRWVEGRKGVFFLEKGSRCRLLALSHDPVEIAVELKYRGVLHIRRVRIEREELQVEDRSDHPFEVDLDQGELLSRGYGKRVRDPSAILSS